MRFFFDKCAMPLYFVAIATLLVVGIILVEPFHDWWVTPPHQMLGTILMAIAAVMAFALGEVQWWFYLLSVDREERRIARNVAPFLAKIFSSF